MNSSCKYFAHKLKSMSSFMLKYVCQSFRSFPQTKFYQAVIVFKSSSLPLTVPAWVALHFLQFLKYPQKTKLPVEVGKKLLCLYTGLFGGFQWCIACRYSFLVYDSILDWFGYWTWQSCGVLYCFSPGLVWFCFTGNISEKTNTQSDSKWLMTITKDREFLGHRRPPHCRLTH